MLLNNRLSQLESDLLANPPQISAYSELPCALFQYDPADEWVFRQELKKLQTRIENAGKVVQLLSLSDLMWQAIEKVEGLGPVAELEVAEGWERAQEQVNSYLSDPDFAPLPDAVSEFAADLDPEKTVLFLWRAAALSPGIYMLSKLLDEMKGKLGVLTVLFYPGLFEESGLSFMGLQGRETGTNYRAKIYH